MAESDLHNLIKDEDFLDKLNSQFEDATVYNPRDPKSWLQTSDGKIYGFPYEYFRRKGNIKLSEVYLRLEEKRR